MSEIEIKDTQPKIQDALYQLVLSYILDIKTPEQKTNFGEKLIEILNKNISDLEYVIVKRDLLTTLQNQLKNTTDYSEAFKNDPDSDDDYNMIAKK